MITIDQLKNGPYLQLFVHATHNSYISHLLFCRLLNRLITARELFLWSIVNVLPNAFKIGPNYVIEMDLIYKNMEAIIKFWSRWLWPAQPLHISFWNFDTTLCFVKTLSSATTVSCSRFTNINFRTILRTRVLSHLHDSVAIVVSVLENINNYSPLNHFHRVHEEHVCYGVQFLKNYLFISSCVSNQVFYRIAFLWRRYSSVLAKTLADNYFWLHNVPTSF